MLSEVYLDKDTLMRKLVAITEENTAGPRGLTSLSVRRYCADRDIRRLTNDDLDEKVEDHMKCNGDSYGRRMMQGSIRFLLGVTSGAVSQTRISAGLHASGTQCT